MSSFPVTLDSLGTAADGTIIYASHINDIRSAIEKIEVKVGIDDSNDSSSVDYSLRYAGLVGTISTDPLTAATLTGVITAAGAYFTFSSAVSRLFINVHPDVVDYIYLNLNTVSCTTTNWDFCITGGTQFKYEDEKNLVSTVGIYCATNLTLNTNYIVKGIV